MVKENITKEYIIEYFKNYYEKNKKTPTGRHREHPFSEKTIRNKFGGWSKALIEANIPLNLNKSQEVICKQCKKQFKKSVNQIKKSNNNFCSRSCSAIYNNSIRSKETNNKIRLALQKKRKCTMCDNFIKGGNRKTCSDYCIKQSNINNGKINGKKAGKASAASQQRRSKNEFLFSELCIKYFGEDDIQCNEQIFKDINGNFWDCDIYIKSLKIAILYDGWYWHYRPDVSKKQKTRDLLKRKIILNNGCEYYTIIDRGKFNKNFVEEQFNLFLHKLSFKKVLNELVN